MQPGYQTRPACSGDLSRVDNKSQERDKHICSYMQPEKIPMRCGFTIGSSQSHPTWSPEGVMQPCLWPGVPFLSLVPVLALIFWMARHICVLEVNLGKGKNSFVPDGSFAWYSWLCDCSECSGWHKKRVTKDCQPGPPVLEVAFGITKLHVTFF